MAVPPPLPPLPAKPSTSAVWSRNIGIAALGLVILSGIVALGMFLSTFLHLYKDIKNKSKETREWSRIHQVLLACRAYVSDHDGRYPESLAALAESELIETSQLESALAPGSIFLYRPGFNSDSDPDEIFVASPVAHKRWPEGLQRVVARVGAKIEAIPEDRFQSDYAHLFP